MRTSPKLRQSAKRSYQELSNHFPEPEQPTSPLPRRLRARRSRALTLEINQCVQHSPETESAPAQPLGVPQFGDLQAELTGLALHSTLRGGVQLPSVAGMEVDHQVASQDHQQPSQEHAEGVDDNRGEQGNLRDWLDPVVPGPVPGLPPEDADGWSRIDQVGAWDCALCQFRTLEEVPPPYRQKWTRALSTILRRILAAQSEEELNRGLKWFLISAQVFFREPKRGGKKGQSNGHLAARFDCVMRGDWGSLLTIWKADKDALESRNRNTRRI